MLPLTVATFVFCFWFCSLQTAKVAGKTAPLFEEILGTCVLLPTEKELPSFIASLKKSGFQWIQTDIPLSRINPAPGVYHFNYNGFESALRMIHRERIRILLKFLGQADWVSRDPTGPHSEWDSTLNLTPPKDETSWSEVVRQITTRFGTYCFAWQIGNEPDGGGFFRGSADDYIRYLQWTSKAIRSVQKKSMIVGGELFLGDTPLFRLMLERPETFDVLSIHYPLAPPDHAKPIESYLRPMREKGVVKPVWNTEQLAGITCDYLSEGATTHIGTEGGLRLSPLKAVAHCLALGIEKVFLFSWNYDENSIGYRPDVQTECRVTSDWLNHTVFLQKVPTGSQDVTVYRFGQRNGRHLLAFWTEVKGLRVPLILKGADRVTLITHKGAVESLAPSNGQLRLVADVCPKIVAGLQPHSQVLINK